MNPIVIDPPDFDADAVWDGCIDWVDKHGGMAYSDGTPNMMAAAGADPGICSCPACHENYWHLGRKQRCRKCGFEYLTDAWPMYSYGVQNGHRREDRIHIPGAMKHPYYKYGFEHPVDDAWKEFHKLDWRRIMPVYETDHSISGTCRLRTIVATYDQLVTLLGESDRVNIDTDKVQAEFGGVLINDWIAVWDYYGNTPVEDNESWSLWGNSSAAMDRFVEKLEKLQS